MDVDRQKVTAETAEEAQDLADMEGTEMRISRNDIVSLSMQVKGKRPVSDLIARLSEIDGILQVGSLSEDTELD